MNHSNKKKLNDFINILLEKEIVANKFNRPEYQPARKVDEPNGGPLGNVLFSSERIDGVDTTEPNTQEEDEIFKSISRHIGDNSDGLMAKNINQILALIDQGKYDLLKPMDGYVYRAMMFDIYDEEIFGKLGLTIEDIKNNATNKPWIFEPNNVSLTPKTDQQGFMSWTYNLSEFGLGDMVTIKENTVLVIVRASVPDSGTFVMNPLLTKKINSLRFYKKERETISYGDINIDKMLVYLETNENTNPSKDIEYKIKSILKIVTNLHLKEINNIIIEAEEEVLNYLNEQPELINNPLKGIDELDSKYHIYNLPELKSLFNKQETENITQTIFDIVGQKYFRVYYLAEKYRKQTIKLLLQKIPNLNQSLIRDSLEDHKLFNYGKKYLVHSEVIFAGGFKHTFSGEDIEKVIESRIRSAALSIIPYDLSYETRKTELKKTRNMLFRMFQNEP